jgi:signal transduction histidine kinase
LRRAGFEVAHERVQSEGEMAEALEKSSWDLIIADYIIPGFGGLQALDLVKRKNMDVPFILVSGYIGEDLAVAAMKAGAHDYLMKDKLVRLAPAVQRELAEAEVRRARRKAEEQLATKAIELEKNLEQLRKTEEELRQKNEYLRKAREELEMRVQERTFDLQRTLKELQRQMKERQRLENELLEITEKERRRIGLDLHDDLGQRLHGIALMLEALHIKMQQKQSELAEDVSKVKDRLSKAINYAHDLAHDMAALEHRAEDLGLSLKRLATHIQETFAINCELHLSKDLQCIPVPKKNHLYKIAQEAATNAIKHAQAQTIRFHVTVQGGEMVMKIQNDGKPFPRNIAVQDRMGLRIMNYRANVIGGKLTIRADRQGWTVLSCSMPLEESSGKVNAPIPEIHLVENDPEMHLGEAGLGERTAMMLDVQNGRMGEQSNGTRTQI